MPPVISARACCRVDLAGGTLDIWPLGLLHRDGRTVNLAIDLEARVELEPRERGYLISIDGQELAFESLAAVRGDERTALIGETASHFALSPCAIRLASESPRGAGLGGSSALTIALIAAVERLMGSETEPAARAAVARDLEARLMSLPTGQQDHFPALLGGVLEIQHRPGGERVRPLRVDLETLGPRLVVVHSGRSHFSAGHNWQVVRRRLDGDAESRRLFDGIAAVAAAMPAALEAADWPRVGQLMNREWGLRRHLAPGISTPELERLLSAAHDEGAWGGKACGAGGGGCVALLCPPERRSAVEQALSAAGGQLLAAPPRRRGLVVSGRFG